VYGSNTGLVGRNQTLTQASPGVAGNAESGDLFGAALARGIFFNNFNGDDFADLAVGAPGETVGGQLSAGAVNIQYGSATGLPGPGGQLFTPDSQARPAVEPVTGQVSGRFPPPRGRAPRHHELGARARVVRGGGHGRSSPLGDETAPWMLVACSRWW
jgi:FG-GAP repeat